MGNTESRFGYHVLRVKPGSPAAKAGLCSYFDYIVGVGDISCLTDSSQSAQLASQAKSSLGKPLKLICYNSLEDSLRETQITPMENWEDSSSSAGGGILGCSVRFLDCSKAKELFWKIERVHAGSPAEKASLKPGEWIICSLDKVLLQEGDFDFLISKNPSSKLGFVVYSQEDVSVGQEKGNCREVWVEVGRNEWNNGVLGCEVSFGPISTAIRLERQARLIESAKQEVNEEKKVNEVVKEETKVNEVVNETQLGKALQQNIQLENALQGTQIPEAAQETHSIPTQPQQIDLSATLVSREEQIPQASPETFPPEFSQIQSQNTCPIVDAPQQGGNFIIENNLPIINNIIPMDQAQKIPESTTIDDQQENANECQEEKIICEKRTIDYDEGKAMIDTAERSFEFNGVIQKENVESDCAIPSNNEMNNYSQSSEAPQSNALFQSTFTPQSNQTPQYEQTVQSNQTPQYEQTVQSINLFQSTEHSQSNQTPQSNPPNPPQCDFSQSFPPSPPPFVQAFPPSSQLTQNFQSLSISPCSNPFGILPQEPVDLFSEAPCLGQNSRRSSLELEKEIPEGEKNIQGVVFSPPTTDSQAAVSTILTPDVIDLFQ